MTEDRLMVAQAVFNGQLSEEHLTIEEIDEFSMLVVDAAIEQELVAAESRGCNVFSGFEGGDTIH